MLWNRFREPSISNSISYAIDFPHFIAQIPIFVAEMGHTHTYTFTTFTTSFFLLNLSETKTIPHTQDRITRKIMQ